MKPLTKQAKPARLILQRKGDDDMPQKPTTTAPTAQVAITPTDQLIAAMARLVEDREQAPRIRHLFLSQANGNLQVSLDMHAPAEG